MLYSMKTSTLSLLLLITYASVSNADIIFSENFETDGLNQRYNSAQEGTFNGPKSARDWHWQRQSINKSGNTKFYNNTDFGDYWVGINLDENGSTLSNPSALSFKPISLIGFNSTYLEIDLASSIGLEKTDFLSIFVTNFESQQKIRLDSFEYGTSVVSEHELSSTFKTFRYDLVQLDMDSFILSIEAFSNASKESFAIDSIKVTGEQIHQRDEDEVALSIDAPNHLLFMSFFGGLLWLRKRM